MSSSLSSSNVFETNPYEGHPGLSELEAEVLWQYAKLAQNVKEVCYSRGGILRQLTRPIVDRRNTTFVRGPR